MSNLTITDYADATSLEGSTRMVYSPTYPPTYDLIAVDIPKYIKELQICSEQGDTSKRNWNNWAHYHYRVELPENSMRVHVVEDYAYQGLWMEAELPALAAWSWGSADPWNINHLGNSTIVNLEGNGTDLVPDPPDLDVLLFRAVRSMLPNIKPNLSLINSIIELKDFKGLGESLTRIAKGLGEVGKLFDKLPGNSRSKSLAKISKSAAEAHLQVQFNFKPLMSDIKGLLQSFKRYQAQAMRLMSNARKAKRVHRVQYLSFPDEQGSYALNAYTPANYLWRLNVNAGNNYPPDTWGPPTGCAAASCAARSRLEPVKFHVELEYSYDYDELQKQHAALFALMDNLGVNLDPSVIWNAIPYSFVVDWVVGIGPFLEQFKRRNLEPVTYIRRALWSVLYKREINCEISWYNLKNAPVAVIREEAFKRLSFKPTYLLPKASGISLMEASLGGALAITRRPRCK